MVCREPDELIRPDPADAVCELCGNWSLAMIVNLRAIAKIKFSEES